MCPHSTNPDASPSMCSQCAGATPRIVRQVGAAIEVDGVVARTFDPGSDAVQPRTQQARRRGGDRGQAARMATLNARKAQR